ncbi:hypothetical protein NDU88_000617 [Pleurodeles waltl]|uniref:Uncharacterized protein n=1 Tax=Pleurodeles waltl TaxID=8319 RepID=A0AAV7U7N7_PLEWA|nr:hypothetical protein NDU88_000617 [Pleurodeles waltl]
MCSETVRGVLSPLQARASDKSGSAFPLIGDRRVRQGEESWAPRHFTPKETEAWLGNSGAGPDPQTVQRSSGAAGRPR